MLNSDAPTYLYAGLVIIMLGILPLEPSERVPSTHNVPLNVFWRQPGPEGLGFDSGIGVICFVTCEALSREISQVQRVCLRDDVNGDRRG